MDYGKPTLFKTLTRCSLHNLQQWEIKQMI